MAQYLYRLGRFAARRRRLVLAAWLGVLLLSVVAAGTLSDATDDSFSIPGTESQRALDLMAAELPGSEGASARVVFAAPEGQTLESPDVRAAIDETVARLAEDPTAIAVSDPFETRALSADGRIALSTVNYALPVEDLTDETVAALEDAPEAARAAGLQVELGGDALARDEHSSTAEIIGIAVAAVVLLITFGSLVAAGLPLLTAIIGVGIGLALITTATGFFTLSSTAPTLALMLGLAVGIDYALFIVTRVRQMLGTGLEPEEAIARSIATAGSAVVFAGLTVVIALTGLVVVGIPFLSVMGLCAAVTVVVAVLVATTLLPALLGFAGDSIDRWRTPFVRVHRGLGSEKDAVGRRWGRLLDRRPAAIVGLVVIGLAVVAIPATDLELGLPSDGTLPASTTQRQAYDLLSEGMGPGSNGPLALLVDAREAGDPAGAVRALEAELADIDGVASSTPVDLVEGTGIAVATVVPTSGPAEAETAELVRTIRDQLDGVEDRTGLDVSVTGTTAVGIDVSQKLSDALPIYLLVVVGLALALLLLAFRSILVPIKAVAGFLLSVASSFGAVVAVFQWGWLKDVIGLDTTGPIISFLPILLIGVLFGLAMDYEVFLVSRIREDYVHGGDARSAVVEGVQHSSRVITAAALIMISVFSAFVLGDDPTIKMIGFGLAAGIAIDAFVIRMTFVPAVLCLLGDRAWKLPGWLDRALPDLDIEGEKLVTADGSAVSVTPPTPELQEV